MTLTNPRDDTMESEFRQPTRQSNGSRCPPNRPETGEAPSSSLDASIRSTHSSSSSGVGIASSYLQSQISLRRSLNDWDEDDPQFLARQESCEEEQPESAFRSNTSAPQRKSNLEVCNPISATINASHSAPNDLGYMHNSLTFQDKALTTMDPSQRSGSDGALNVDDEYIGEIDSEADLLRLLSANNDFINEDELDSSSSSNSESSDGELDKSELDSIYRDGKLIVTGSHDSLDPVRSSDQDEEESELDTTPKMSNGDIITKEVSELPQVPSPSEISPSSTDTLQGLDDIDPPSNEQRRLSLVSLLKIQRISEHAIFNEEIQMEETGKSGSEDDGRERSVVNESELGESCKGGDESDGVANSCHDNVDLDNEHVDDTENSCHDNSDVDNEHVDDSESVDDEDAVRIEILPLECGDSSRINALDISEISEEHPEQQGNMRAKSTGSFLPLPHTEEKIIHNPPSRSRSSSLKSQRNSPVEGEDSSSTFFLQSIKSTDHVTHISDAPDYDYNSISSSDEDGKAATSQNADVSNQPERRSEMSPTERRRLSLVRKELEVSDQVCRLLGLPKDEGARKLNRGIMSKDTELQLRNLLKKEQVAKQQQVAPETAPKHDSESDTDQKQQEDLKWEAIRQERLVKRLSSKKQSKSIPAAPQDAEPDANGETEDGLPNKINEVNSSETNHKSGNHESAEMKDASSVNSESSSSSVEILFREKRGSKRGSTSSDSQTNSVTFAKNRALPKRVMPPKNTCPIQRVEKDDDHSVFSTFSKSFRSGLLRRVHRESETSSESNAQSLNSNPLVKGTSSYMSIFGTKNPADDGPLTRQDSKSSRSSRRKSSFAAFLGWQHPEPSVDEESDTSDDESTDDEGDDTSWNKNILSEGEYYLAMSMLVYMYALLRETANLGYTEISFDEVDVNSFQSELNDSSKNGALAKTKSAGFIIRVVLDELEKKDAFETVSDMSVLKEFKKWVHDSRCNIDVATESTITELRRKVARTRWKRAIGAVRITIRLKKSSSQITIDQHRLHTINDPSINIQTKRVSALGERNRGLSRSLNWVSSAKTQIMNSLGVSAQNGNQSTEKLVQDNKLLGKDEIKQIIDDALEQPRFFRQGSLMSNLIESGIEVVWFGDRHPNDVVYAICCNRKQKRVSVVFRGTVNSHNWLMNMKFSMAEHINPIPEDYYGRTSLFGLHTGFSLYLSRQRKDDSNTKIEEIFLMIDQIGRAIAPDGDYELSITGHSLGGALATLLAFYAATSSTFDHLKSIRVFTFAAPRVGDQRFLYAFQHLERIGKLRLARFSNTQDIVPLIPFTCVDRFKIGRPYMHVGMHIRLHGTSNWAQYWLRTALDVTYPKQEGIMSHIRRGFLNSVFTNLNTLKGFVRNHTLSEYQRRIHFALEYRNALAKTSFKYDKRRNRIKTLEEYYFIRGATTVTCTRDLTEVNLEARESELYHRKMRRIVAILALVALIEGIVLVRMIDISHFCESTPKLLCPLFSLVLNEVSEKAETTGDSGDSALSAFAPIESKATVSTAPIDSNTIAEDENDRRDIASKLAETRDNNILLDGDESPGDHDTIKSASASKFAETIDRNTLLQDVESPENPEANRSPIHSDEQVSLEEPESDWNRNPHNNLFYQANLVWGIRNVPHYEIPSNILEQRMKMFDSTSILEISQMKLPSLDSSETAISPALS